MRSCPYPHHNGNGSATPLASAANDAAAFVNCSATSCLQPSLFCASCDASNRTLARYCRNCRQALAFEQTLQQTHASWDLAQSRLTKNARLAVLSRLKGRAVTALENVRGYLVFAAQGWGLGVMANTSLTPPRLLFHHALTEGEEIHTLQQLDASSANPAVLAVSRSAIYHLACLPRFECRELFHAPEGGWQIEGTLGLAEQIIVRLYHPKTRGYRWLALEGFEAQARELALPTRGPFSAMIAAPEAQKFFCATEAEIVQYDLRDQNVQRVAAPAFGLNVKARPQVHARTGEIFWQGLDGMIYRSPAEATTKSPKVFGRQRVALVHFFCGLYDDYLCALTKDNLLVWDYPSGAEVWNFSQNIQAKISCSAAPPRAVGTYLMFAFRSASLAGPEERVGLFSLTKREAPVLLHPSVATSPMPVAGVASLIAVRQPQSSEEREKSALMLFPV